MDTWSTKIYRTSRWEAALLLNGVYIPPARAQTMREDRLDPLRWSVDHEATQSVLSRISARDFSVAGWLMALGEWCDPNGVRALNDPAISTRARSHPVFSLGMTKRAGGYGPANCPYPAEASTEETASNHVPVQLFLPCERPEPPRGARKFHLKDTTEGRRGDLGDRLGGELEQAGPELGRRYAHKNVTHFCVRFERIS